MDPRTQAWELTLDHLEADLGRAEELADSGIGADVAPWRPPVLDGPLPEALRPRAADLLERQQLLRDRLSGLIARTGRQLDVARKVSSSLRRSAHTTTRTALYIDTTA